MSDYWLGVITPFIVIAGLALTAGITYVLFRVGDWFAERTHNHMIEKITVDRNLADPFGTREKRPEYFDNATKFRDALLLSPKMWLIRCFGFVIILVRDYEQHKEPSVGGRSREQEQATSSS